MAPNEITENVLQDIPATTEYVIGTSEKDDIAYLLEKCHQNMMLCDDNVISSAFDYCVLAHEGQRRKSGNKFYTHPLAVALILVNEIPLDTESVAAALLHNVLDESDIYTFNDIVEAFGIDIARIVEGVSKIKKIEISHINSIEQADNYRRLLLTLSADPRIILVKLADRLESMRTLQYIATEHQKKVAQETLNIYSPFANRLGLSRMKFELEDLSFRYLHPDKYQEIEEILEGTHSERTQYVEEFKQPLIELLSKDEFLKNQSITYRINGRAKNIYSIYNKTILRQKRVEELYDIFAIRIILNTNNPFLCYYVYGIVANHYPLLEGTFKDYISTPKPNGYKSLHFVVRGLKNRFVEVQIRTEDMHRNSELGVAAHFKYKSGIGNSQVFEDGNVSEWLSAIRSILDSNISESGSQLYNMISGIAFDAIYVFTPKLEFKELQKGSTCLDFAFEIHTEVGFHSVGAKVNGRFESLDYILSSGDKVEIITSEKSVPQEDWLHFVITHKAQIALLQYFKREYKKNYNKGMEMWREECAKFGYSSANSDFSIIQEDYNVSNVNDFFVNIGKGELSVENIFRSYILRSVAKEEKKIEEHFSEENETEQKQKSIVHTQDCSKLPMVFRDCCSPLPGDNIFGFNEQDKITIHSIMCHKYEKLLHAHISDIMQVDWGMFPEQEFRAYLRVSAEVRQNIIQEILEKIIGNGGQMFILDSQQDHINLEVIFGFKLTNKQFISSVIKDIQNIDGIISVERLTTPVQIKATSC